MVAAGRGVAVRLMVAGHGGEVDGCGGLCKVNDGDVERACGCHQPHGHAQAPHRDVGDVVPGEEAVGEEGV